MQNSKVFIVGLGGERNDFDQVPTWETWVGLVQVVVGIIIEVWDESFRCVIYIGAQWKGDKLKRVREKWLSPPSVH